MWRRKKMSGRSTRHSTHISSGSGGLGWYIYENKNQLEIPNVFAGLLTVIVIGLVVENVIFRMIEARTVRRWGMQN